jgi:DNA mismatch repair protein MutL
MGNIVLLDDLTINQIAAGEVIERPASVIKEMLENSIDAGAKNVTIEVKNGGISLIRITDDGCGIAEDDMEIAFERHATSKIRRAEDLETVKSMGFRGEALASIAAIAKVEMVSKKANSSVGNKIVLEGGEVLEKTETGCPNGTKITVENLFYNTPVRYKFLKKDYTEAGYIEDAVTRIALVNKDVAITLINNGKTIIHTSGNGDMKSIIYSIYGKDIANGMIDVDYTYENMRVTGVIGKPEIAKATRSNQLFFVNNRFVKDKTLTAATDKAYKEVLPFGKFGFLVLNLEMDPKKVDVNVHPAKLEVRFQDESTVFKAIYHAIKMGLEISNNPLKSDEINFEKLVPDSAKNNELRETEVNKILNNLNSTNITTYANSNIENYAKQKFLKEEKIENENKSVGKIESIFAKYNINVSDIPEVKHNASEYLAKYYANRDAEKAKKYQQVEEAELAKEAKETAIITETENKEDEVLNKEKDVDVEKNIEKSEDKTQIIDSERVIEEVKNIKENTNEQEVTNTKLTEEKNKIEENENSEITTDTVIVNTTDIVKEINDNKEVEEKIEIDEKELSKPINVIGEDFNLNKDSLAQDNQESSETISITEKIDLKNDFTVPKITTKPVKDLVEDGTQSITEKLLEQKLNGASQDTQLIDTVKIREALNNVQESKEFEEMYKKTFGVETLSVRKEKEQEEEEINASKEFDYPNAENESVFESEEFEEKVNYKFVGMIFDSNVIIEMSNEMFIIDQKAAQERLLYENIKENYNQDKKDTQVLLLPDIITLNHKELFTAKQNKQLFENVGFEFEEFGENTIKLVSVPSMCEKLNTKQLFLEILRAVDTVAINSKKEKEDKFISVIAAKCAEEIMPTTEETEIDEILQKLLKLENPFTCSNGRIVAIKMTRYDLEKKFSRR